METQDLLSRVIEYLSSTGCPGFHECVSRHFDGNKEDCQECREDALEAAEAIDKEGYVFDAKESVEKGV